MMISLKKSEGLQIIAIVTLLASVLVGLIFFGLLFITRSIAGVSWIGWFLLLFSISGLGLAIILFTDNSSKTVWFAARYYWAALFVFFMLWFSGLFKMLGINLSGWMAVSWEGFSLRAETLTFYLPILAYSMACLLYFQTRDIKEYFHIIENPVEE